MFCQSTRSPRATSNDIMRKEARQYMCRCTGFELQSRAHSRTGGLVRKCGEDRFEESVETTRRRGRKRAASQAWAFIVDVFPCIPRR